VELGVVDLAAVIKAALEGVSGPVQRKSLDLDVDLDRSVGAVAGDAARLQQVVSNLLTNAIKFNSDRGRISVTLEKANGCARIKVSDTGAGIEPEFLPHVFDRFSQADTTNTRMYGGLGLGLAIVRHLSELHGGSVSVTSPGVGQGATFSVRLPLATPTARGRVAPVGAVNGPQTPVRATLAGIQVLVAEDHQDTADLMRTVLQGQGAAVRVVGSIGAALSALAEAEVDVLVSDIGMPDGTGYELAERLRDGERTSGRPAPATVAITAFAGADDRARALAAGFNGWAAKPIDPALLVESVALAARTRLARR